MIHFLLSPSASAIASRGLLVIYLIVLIIYRLFLYPLASFPGPQLAALTRWYEFCFDIAKGHGANLRGKPDDYTSCMVSLIIE